MMIIGGLIPLGIGLLTGLLVGFIFSFLTYHDREDHFTDLTYWEESDHICNGGQEATETSKNESSEP